MDLTACSDRLRRELIAVEHAAHMVQKAKAKPIRDLPVWLAKELLAIAVADARGSGASWAEIRAAKAEAKLK